MVKVKADNQKVEGLKGLASIKILSALLLVILSACGKKSSPKFSQYYVQGEKLYLRHCSNCHQADGSGLARLYPPLDSSDYMQENFQDVICLIRYGEEGDLVVNGTHYNQPMQGITSLSDLEIAEVTTYIYNTWTHNRGLIDVKDVSVILRNCRTTP